mgnify:CR=1 FL=1
MWIKHRLAKLVTMNRREFIKNTGMGAVALGTGLAGCRQASKKSARANEEPATMEMRTNPGNGDKVSLLGYGCMRWPMEPDENGKDKIVQDTVNQLVDRALEGGVNYFDTSPAYLQGQSERAAGIALSRHPRSRYFLATKLSNFRDASKEATFKMYHDSFEDLQTDYLDYYLLHSIGRGGYEKFAERYVDNGAIDFLMKEREKGTIRQLGFSFHGSKEQFDILLPLHSKYHWDFVQIEMNYVDWKHADGVRNVNADYLYEEIDKLGIPMVVMEPLLGGRLAAPPKNVVDLMKEREPDRSAASWAMRFVGTYPSILTSLSGMTYMEHLEENLDTFTGFNPLTAEELEFLERMAVLIKEYPMVNCTNCKYCMPCPYGIDIPEIFKHYNSCVSDGSIPQSASQKSFRKLKRAYLESYLKAVPKERQADHCIGCGQCMVHCPQSIPIPSELQRIDRYVDRLKREDL